MPVVLGPALQAMAPSRNVKATTARAAISRRRRLISIPKVAPGMGPRMAGNPYTEVAESPMDLVACRRVRFVANAATVGLMRREMVQMVRSMLVQARLTFRLHRFTLVAVSAMLILGSVAALFVAF